MADDLALIRAEPSTLTAHQRIEALRAIAAARAWLDSREALVLAAGVDADDAAAVGATGPAALLKSTGGVNGHTATRRVRSAHALSAVPAALDALADGDISADHAAVLGALWADLSPQAREALVADQENVVGLAAGVSPETFRNRLGVWRRAHDPQGHEAAEQARRDRTTAKHGHDDDGMGWLHAALTPEGLAIFAGVLDGLVDELWRAQHAAASPDAAVPHSVRTNSQLRADAMVEMARRASGATAADARKALAAMHVLIDLQTLMHGLHENSLCELGDGTPISAEAARRLACECNLIPHVLGGDGRTLDIGHGRRLATDAQRDALRVEYRGCCGISGCDVPFDYCAIHHIIWWEHDGPTDLANLLPLCSKHHRFVHDRHWTLRQTRIGAYTLDPPTLAAA